MDKVVFLTNSSPIAMITARAIAAHVSLALVVAEKRTPRFRSPVKKIANKLLGNENYEWLRSLRKPSAERKMIALERRLVRESERMSLDKYPGGGWPEGVEGVETDDVNHEECVESIRKVRPDLIVVYGTGIIRKEVIEIPRIGCINCHSSVLPDYRGTFVEFWQAYNGDLEKVGVTVHFIDEGVDTGDIIFQKRAEGLTGSENPHHLRGLNTLLTVENIGPVAKSVLDGDFSRTPQQKSSMKTYKYRDLTLDRKQELYGRLGLL